jgi:hypothetical protein
LVTFLLFFQSLPCLESRVLFFIERISSFRSSRMALLCCAGGVGDVFTTYSFSDPKKNSRENLFSGMCGKRYRLELVSHL